MNRLSSDVSKIVSCDLSDAESQTVDAAASESLAEETGERTTPPTLLQGDELQRKINELKKTKVLETPQLLSLFQWLDMKRLIRQSCRIIGPSGTGKTFSCDTYRLRNPQRELVCGNHKIIPVVFWLCSSKMSLSGLLRELLKSIGCEFVTGSVNHLRNQLYEEMALCKLEMLIIDEAQRLSVDLLSEVRDISDRGQIAVVLVGTDRLKAVLNRDEQIRRRFSFGYQFARLDIEGIREMTGLWERDVLNLPESSNLTHEPAQRHLRAVSQGYVGPLMDVLKNAAVQSWHQGHSRIHLSTLREVAKSRSL